jgi:hypothetical protein
LARYKGVIDGDFKTIAGTADSLGRLGRREALAVVAAASR